MSEKVPQTHKERRAKAYADEINSAPDPQAAYDALIRRCCHGEPEEFTARIKAELAPWLTFAPA